MSRKWISCGALIRVANPVVVGTAIGLGAGGAYGLLCGAVYGAVHSTIQPVLAAGVGCALAGALAGGLMGVCRVIDRAGDRVPSYGRRALGGDREADAEQPRPGAEEKKSAELPSSRLFLAANGAPPSPPGRNPALPLRG